MQRMVFCLIGQRLAQPPPTMQVASLVCRHLSVVIKLAWQEWYHS